MQRARTKRWSGCYSSCHSRRSRPLLQPLRGRTICSQAHLLSGLCRLDADRRGFLPSRRPSGPGRSRAASCGSGSSASARPSVQRPERARSGATATDRVPAPQGNRRRREAGGGGSAWLGGDSEPHCSAAKGSNDSARAGALRVGSHETVDARSGQFLPGFGQLAGGSQPAGAVGPRFRSARGRGQPVRVVAGVAASHASSPPARSATESTP